MCRDLYIGVISTAPRARRPVYILSATKRRIWKIYIYVQEQVLEDERWQKILVSLANHPEKQGSDSDEVCSDDEGAWGRSMFR